MNWPFKIVTSLNFVAIQPLGRVRRGVFTVAVAAACLRGETRFLLFHSGCFMFVFPVCHVLNYEYDGGGLKKTT